MTETKNLPEKKQPNPVVEGVLQRIKSFQEAREIDLPPDYSAPNALRAAWLILQNTKTKADKSGNKKSVLDVCTRPSIANALLDMVIQGLNPHKRQCSFVAYGNQLVMQREYQGARAVAKRVDKNLEDTYAEVVYKDDVLEFEIERGRRKVTKHQQSFQNISNDNIIGAYAVAVDKQGEVKRCELMTLEQIFAAWRMSKNFPFDDKGNLKPTSTHAKFKDEMVKKTVMNRLCKHLINSSSDSGLVLQSVRRTDDEAAQAEAQAEIDEFANTGDIIDIDPPVEEAETDELTEEEKAEIMAAEAAAAEPKTGIAGPPVTGPGF